MPSPNNVFGRLADALSSDWRTKARPNQLPPAGDWSTWLILAGRGWGKTRTGAEFVRAQKLAGASRIAIVGATASDARDVMIEGESGILACSPKHDRPEYEPSKRRLTWPNGALATAYSADEPERLRGPQHDCAWCDELGAWRYPDAWDQLQFGLRLGKNPRIIVTTTPRPTKLIRDLVTREGRGVVVTRGSTYENRDNLAAAFFEQVVGRYEGTRLGRQELNAELLDDTPGALWRQSEIEAARIKLADLPPLRRVVVALDPPVTSGGKADECGIVVAGLASVGGTDHAFVLADYSMRGTPREWAARGVQAYLDHEADRIVAEVNQGGELVENTIRMVDPNVSYRAVHASRGKVVRAEPVAALYEQKRIHHVGIHPVLEDQMTAFTTDFNRSAAGYSPDRVDALVWAITDLMVTYQQRVPVVMPIIVTKADAVGPAPHMPSRPEYGGGGAFVPPFWKG